MELQTKLRMKNEEGKPLKDLPNHFQEELKQLQGIGINNWSSLKKLNDSELFSLSQNTRATQRNLKFIRGMATLICEIDLSQSEAALLMHAGIASIEALASLTPSEVLQKTGRLERLLKTGRKPYVDMKLAKYWIKSAKRANSELTQ